MTWEEAGELCYLQVPQIARRLPADYWPAWDFPARCEHLFLEHERFRPAADAAIAQWISTQQWPTLPPGSPNFLVCARLTCAVDTVNLLLVEQAGARLVADPLPRVGHRRDVLTWLLTASWHEWRWDSWLKLEVLRSLNGEGSFYAPPPPTPVQN